MGLGMDRTAPRLQPETALGMTEIHKTLLKIGYPLFSTLKRLLNSRIWLYT